MERLEAVEKIALIQIMVKELERLKPYNIEDIAKIRFYMTIAKKLEFPEDFIKKYEPVRVKLKE